MYGRLLKEISLLRLVSLLVISLLLMPLTVQPARQVIFLLQLNAIDGIDSDSKKLAKLVFTPDAFSSLAFEKEEREFRYQGEMYDVRSIIKGDDQIVVLALKDVFESRLLLAFENPAKMDGSAVPGAFKIGFLPYFQVNPLTLNYQAVEFFQLNYSRIQIRYADPGSWIFSPPPQIA